MAKQLTIEFMARADAYFSKIDEMEKRTNTAMSNMQNSIQKIEQANQKVASSFDNITSSITKIAGALGIAFGTQQIISYAEQGIKLAAGLNELRDTFRGTKEDLELFRKATAGTVNESSLIKMSNQATMLGLSMQEQAKFMYLSREAAHSLGITVEEAFTKLLNSTEGATRGLKLVGIQKAVYEQTIKDLVKSLGGETEAATTATGEHELTIKNLDAETQKRIRIQAILATHVVTMNDINNVQQTENDKLKEFDVKIEELKISIGEKLLPVFLHWIDVLEKLPDRIDKVGEAVKRSLGSDTISLLQKFSEYTNWMARWNETQKEHPVAPTLPAIRVPGTGTNIGPFTIGAKTYLPNGGGANMSMNLPEGSELNAEGKAIPKATKINEDPKKKHIEASVLPAKKESEILKKLHTESIEDQLAASDKAVKAEYNSLSAADKKKIDLEKALKDARLKIENDYEKEVISKSSGYQESKDFLTEASKGKKSPIEQMNEANRRLLPDYQAPASELKTLKEGNPFYDEKSDNVIKNITKDLDKQKEMARSAADAIVSGFEAVALHGENVINVMEGMILQLAEMIAKALVFDAIMSFLTGGASTAVGGAAGAEGVLGSVVSVPSGQTPLSPTSGILSALGQVNGSIQALNLNQIQRGAQPVIIMLDGKVLATSGVKNQNNFEDRNVKLARVG